DYYCCSYTTSSPFVF
nr:immunoglobulin light chain junction region [Macaca mulatta]